MISIIKRFLSIDNIQLLDGQIGYCKEDDTLYIGVENNKVMPISIIKRFDNYENVNLLNGQLGYCLDDNTLYIGLENEVMPTNIIRLFENYDSINLINGQLGFCLEDNTLYIGKEDGFISVSSDAASVGDLKERVDKLREDADNIFSTLDQRAAKALALLDQAKTAKEYLDNKADEIDTRINQKYDTEVDRLDEKIDEVDVRLDSKINEVDERLNTKIDGVDDRLDDKIDEVDQRHIEENERIDEILNRPLMYKSTFPDYENIEDENRFENELSWEIEENGYILVTAKGLCDFEVLIDEKPLIRKVLEDDPTRTDLEVAFSQVFQVAKNSVVSINEISKTYSTYTCQFIPYKLEEIGPVYRTDQKDFIDLIYPVGSIYMSMIGTNPGTLFGKGNWNLIAPGRVLVGIDSSDNDFNTVRKDGGSKTHTLGINEMPSHTHIQNAHTHTQNAHKHAQSAYTSNSAQNNTYPSYGYSSGTLYTITNGTNDATAVNQNFTAVNQNTGGGNAHNNLQPYLTCYIWERIA